MSSIEEALNQERKQITFSVESLSEYLYTPAFYKDIKRTFVEYPELPYDHNLHNRGRLALLKDGYKILPLIYNKLQVWKVSVPYPGLLYNALATIHHIPGSVHISMFYSAIDILGDEEQRKEWLWKSATYDIVGCYAQTELAHGSDIKGLLTEARLDQETDQFVVNTGDLEGLKYWPGEMGLLCTHALIFAQLIIKGQKYGVFPFIVQVRDQERSSLPGVQIGDIGPKIGLNSKDNGYLKLVNIRIPRKNMLSRFVKVSKKGEIGISGDPKVGYASMMLIRKNISCIAPKLYMIAIAIATRYSIFRKQFKTKSVETKIIDYQLQQEKIISRIAEYYAINAGGNNIMKLCQNNFQAVKNNDFKYMQEAHACLCVGKAFFSQTVYEGMEICRKACGGHGFSHYSGFPSLINEYAANLTFEGQNTVLYLQIARYILKSYKKFITKQRFAADSLKYIESFDYLMEKKCEVKNVGQWKLEDMRVLLAQGVCYLISIITKKLADKPENISEEEIRNKNAGIDLQKMAILHSVYYTFYSFISSIPNPPNEQLNPILSNLALLYGANQIITHASHLISGGFILSQQLGTLTLLKQITLKKLRNDVIGLVDAFMLPNWILRSALVSGNPYENYLQLARQNDLNKNVLESVNHVLQIKKTLEQPKPKL